MTRAFGRHCCILGGCGFLGSVTAEHLLQAGWQVRVLDREGVDSGRLTPILDRIELRRGDVMNAGDLEASLEGIDLVLHLLGTTIPQSSMRDITYDLQTNVLSTIRVLETMQALAIPRLLYASSGGTVYGPALARQPIREDHPTEPLSAYGISRLMAEKYIRLFAAGGTLRPTILRISNPYGASQDPRRPQGTVSVFLDRMLASEGISIWGDGSVVRDYLYQEDLGAALLALAETPTATGVFNLGSGCGHSLTEVLGMLETELCMRARVTFHPGRGFDVPYNVLDTTRLQECTGWHARTDLAEGIRAMVQAWRSGRGAPAPVDGSSQPGDGQSELRHHRG